MLYPSMVCCSKPRQAFSFSWNRYHSAMPCFTRRIKMVVAFIPSTLIGSSVANNGIPASPSCRSSLSALNVSRPDRSMSSHMTAANRGAGLAASASSAASPPSRGRPTLTVSWAVPWPRCSMSRPPDSMSQYQALMNQPGGSLAWTSQACRRSEAAGSWSNRVEVRPKNATGTGSAGALLVTWACGAGWLIAVAPYRQCYATAPIIVPYGSIMNGFFSDSRVQFLTGFPLVIRRSAVNAVPCLPRYAPLGIPWLRPLRVLFAWAVGVRAPGAVMGADVSGGWLFGRCPAAWRGAGPATLPGAAGRLLLPG